MTLVTTHVVENIGRLASGKGYCIIPRDGYVTIDGRVSRATLTVEPARDQTPHFRATTLDHMTIDVFTEMVAISSKIVEVEEKGEKTVKLEVSLNAQDEKQKEWIEASREGTVDLSFRVIIQDAFQDGEVFFHLTPREAKKTDAACNEKMPKLKYALPHRQWHQATPPITGEDSIVVLTWNILACGLASGPEGEPELKYAGAKIQHRGECETPFRHANIAKNQRNDYGAFVVKERDMLDWNVRKLSIVAEVLKSKPNIICMQEVDRYQDWLKPKFEEAGYESTFQPKSESPALCTGWYSDGVAIFWKKDEFKVVKEWKDVQTTNNPFIILRLQDKKGRALVCATTHLKASEGTAAEARRFAQISELVQRIQCARTWERKTPCALAFCGDFNTDPFSYITQEALVVPYVLANLDVSSVYLLAQKKEDLSSHGGESEDKPAKYFATTAKQRTTGAQSGKTGAALRCIDYMWYSKTDFDVVERLGLPLKQELTENPTEDVMLPCAYPSDHFALAARLKWK